MERPEPISTAPTDPNFTKLTVSFPVATIQNGASEQFLVNGATGGPISLNADPNITNLTLSTVVYSVIGSTSGGIRTLTFTRNSGSFVQANVEALLDALQYKNIAASPTNGIRTFTVNAFNATYKSPDAQFAATVGCVSLSGNIYHDANALTDTTVNGNGPQGQFAPGDAYAVLVNPTNDAKISVAGISAGGAYTFGRMDTGAYYIYISNTGTPGATVTAPTYPAGYKGTGENLGATAGNDLSIDGRIYLKIGSLPVTNANLGAEVPPTTGNSSYSGIPNPGGFNYYLVPNGGFTKADVDGTVDSLVITSFPTGTNYLKTGTTIYTNPLGGTCPPQSICTTWPGTVTIAAAAATTVAVDPASNGDTSVVISFTALDNGHLGSNNGVSSTVTLGFIGQTSPINISGNVWNDANGNGNLDGAEGYSAEAGTGKTLYAILVQTSNTYSGAATVYASTPVTAAAVGYTFTNIPAGNSYEVRLAALAAQPANGEAASAITPALAPGWTDVSTNNNGTINLYSTGTTNPIISLGNVSATKTAINFGMEQTPAADVKAFTAPHAAFTKDATVLIGSASSYRIAGNSASLTGSAMKSLSGSDPEDCATASTCNVGKTFIVKTINANTKLYYNGGSGSTPVTINTTISSYSPANMLIYGQQGQGYNSSTALGFTYSLVDAAGMVSSPVAYTIQTPNVPLPVQLERFEGTVSGCSAKFSWKAASEIDGDYYQLERSNDGSSFYPALKVACANAATGSSYAAEAPLAGLNNFFRLKRVGLGGSFDYSTILKLQALGCQTPDITVQPNPAKDQISIQGLNSGAIISLYNCMGALVHRTIAGHDIEVMDIRSIAPGTYLLQVKTEQGALRANTRVVKQ